MLRFNLLKRFVAFSAVLMFSADIATAELTPKFCPQCKTFHPTGEDLAGELLKEHDKKVDAAQQQAKGDTAGVANLNSMLAGYHQQLLAQGKSPAEAAALMSALAGQIQAGNFNAAKTLPGVPNDPKLNAQIDVLQAQAGLDKAIKDKASPADLKKAAGALSEAVTAAGAKGVDQAATSKAKASIKTYAESLDSRERLAGMIAQMKPDHDSPLQGGLIQGGPTQIIVEQPVFYGGVPVIGEQPIPEAPAALAAAETAGDPALQQGDDASEDAEKTPSGKVVLLNPASTGRTIRFSFGGKAVELPAGDSRELSIETAELIKFDRGGKFGQAKYRLTDGTYEFKISKQGWDLRAKTFEVTLDNSRSKRDFNYVHNNENKVVAAGKTEKLTGKHPVVVSFDRGDGGDASVKELRDGRYRIGVDPKVKLLDLFATTAEELAVESAPSPPSS